MSLKIESLMIAAEVMQEDLCLNQSKCDLHWISENSFASSPSTNCIDLGKDYKSFKQTLSDLDYSGVSQKMIGCIKSFHGAGVRWLILRVNHDN